LRERLQQFQFLREEGGITGKGTVPHVILSNILFFCNKSSLESQTENEEPGDLMRKKKEHLMGMRFEQTRQKEDESNHEETEGEYFVGESKKKPNKIERQKDAPTNIKGSDINKRSFINDNNCEQNQMKKTRNDRRKSQTERLTER
jgi:IMP dehydrogenase/GMP reductase